MAPALAVEIAWRSLARHRLRAALAAAGIVAGVAALVAMTALGRGVQREVDGFLRGIGSNVLLVVSGSIASGGVRTGNGVVPSLTEADAHAIATELDVVEAAAPIIRARAQIVAAERNWSTIVYGTTNGYFDVRDWPVSVGRSFTDDEVASAGKVVILGRSSARRLFGDETSFDALLGERVRVRQVPMTVVGVLDARGAGPDGEDLDDAAFVPLSTAAMRVFGRVQGTPGRVHTVIVEVRDGVPIAEGREAIEGLLRQRRASGAGREDGFVVRDLTERAVARRDAGRTLAALLAAVASIGLAVGGVGILNVMLVSLAERTREIGLRLAVGARGRDILAQFVAEAVTLALAGGAAGVAVGAAAALAMSSHRGWPVELDAAGAALGLAMAAATGLAAGLYPAIRASRLQPVEALRHE